MPSHATSLRLALAALAALALAMGVGRFAFTPLLPMMETDGLLSVSQGGLLASVHFAGYFLGALIAARLTVSPGTVLRVSIVAIALSTLGMGLTDAFPIWLGLRFLAGVCSAFALVLISNHVLRRLQAEGETQLHGWVFSGVGAGILLTGLAVLMLMARHMSSAASWQIIGAASLAVAAFLWFQFQAKFPADSENQQFHASQRAPLEWVPITAYGALGIGYIIPATYLPVMARDMVDAPLEFGLSWPVFGAAAFISTPLAMYAQKYVSNLQIWIASQFVMATGSLLPAAFPHIAAIVGAGICVGGTFMIITMAGMKEAHRLSAGGDAQRLIAVMTAAFAAGQMIGPALAGWAYAATQSFAAPLLLASAALALTAAALARRSSAVRMLGS